MKKSVAQLRRGQQGIITFGKPLGIGRGTPVYCKESCPWGQYALLKRGDRTEVVLRTRLRKLRCVCGNARRT